MKLACVRAIAELAEETDQGDEVAKAYEGHTLEFGPEYLIPKPFDPRLIIKIAPAVAQAAMDSGVATRPIKDMDAYREELGTTVYRTGMVMRPVFQAAKSAPARIVFAEGEDERVLRAAQFVLLEKIAKPIIIGRPAVVEMRLKKMGSKLKPGTDFEIVEPRGRSALSEELAGLSQHRGAPGRDAGEREGGAAQVQHADRRDPGAHGRCRRHDLRPHRHLSGPPEVHRAGVGQGEGRAELRCDEPADAAGPQSLHQRYVRQRSADARATRGHDDACGEPDREVRHSAEGGARCRTRTSAACRRHRRSAWPKRAG